MYVQCPGGLKENSQFLKLFCSMNDFFKFKYPGRTFMLWSKLIQAGLEKKIDWIVICA